MPDLVLGWLKILPLLSGRNGEQGNQLIMEENGNPRSIPLFLGFRCDGPWQGPLLVFSRLLEDKKKHPAPVTDKGLSAGVITGVDFVGNLIMILLKNISGNGVNRQFYEEGGVFLLPD